MDYKTEEQALFLSFGLLLLPKSLYLQRCSTFGAVRMVGAWLHPWQTPGRQQMKVRVYSFAKLQKRSFSGAVSNVGKWEISCIYHRHSFPLRLWFQRRAGQPHRLPVLPHFFPPCALPAHSCCSALTVLLIELVLQACWAWIKNSSGWIRGRKQNIKSPQTVNNCSLFAFMQFIIQGTCSFPKGSSPANLHYIIPEMPSREHVLQVALHMS